MHMEFRRAGLDDLPAIEAVIAQARALLKEQNIDQWQDGYPDAATLTKDIEAGDAWLATIEEKIVGTAALCFGDDPDYRTIYAGNWHFEGPYAALHRVAVSRSAKGSGLSSALFAHLEGISRKAAVAGIRCDTHRDNIAMQKFLKKNGFVYCGIIYLADGAERFAFDKQFSCS